ncbi:MAG: hypothetical protein HYR96_11830, partial [Deltaproteobacteria bacterium]|nr:hypothetical protein [Deltaproteobacteria bacterium]
MIQLVDALKLGVEDADALLLAAGFAPLSIVQPGVAPVSEQELLTGIKEHLPADST